MVYENDSDAFGHRVQSTQETLALKYLTANKTATS